MPKRKPKQLEFDYGEGFGPLCKCGCGEPVTWNPKGRWNTYIKNHNHRRPKPWRYDNSNAPLCACGCGNTVVRSKTTPYNWNEYIHNHHIATEEFVKERWQEPPLCACGCGQRVTRAYRNKKWKKYISLEHQLNDPKYHELLIARNKRFWADPIISQQMLTALRKQSNISPNGFEQDFLSSVENKILFVGNGKLWYKFPDGRKKNPDFIVINGDLFTKNKVIELWGTYWHRDQEPSEMIDLYAGIGIDCIVIWEHDWKDKRESILEQVNIFIGKDKNE